MRIRILIFICCGSGFYLMRIRMLFDADPDLTFHPAADPDPYPDPSFHILRLKHLKKCSYFIHFGLSSANWIGSGFGTSHHFDSDLDPDFYLMPMRIQVNKMMWSRIHNTFSYCCCRVRKGGRSCCPAVLQGLASKHHHSDPASNSSGKYQHLSVIVFFKRLRSSHGVLYFVPTLCF